MAIYYLLTFFSVLLETAKNIFSNSFSKRNLKTPTDIYGFNTVMYSASLTVMLGLLACRPCTLSLYSIGMGLVFALVSGGMQTTMLRALEKGPLSYVNFIQLSGLVLPVLFGFFFLDEAIRWYQIAALPVLLLSMALLLRLRKSEWSGGRWLFHALLSMLCLGLVGIVQALEQASDYAGELYSFLAATFFWIVLQNGILWLAVRKKQPQSFSFRSKAVLQPLLSGLFMGIVNAVNLYLVGVMPGAIFFPLSNGGLLITTMLAAALIFRERLTVGQWVGVLLGLVSLCVIGI